MLNKVEVRLDQKEFDSLYRLARAELRSPADQARYLLRRMLVTEGPFSAEPSTADKRQPAAAAVNGGRNATND